ncbi:Csm2p SCDLUD_002812 [Saccharomycodes ludwigii]|uniref:Csm2p n=1 Tax=Saccharomycodes ludwigii TaxID=36035 RepID=UPI001E88AFE0|nr:hypothetical protein SCDLUD_002812 [Saccharomycodes ludwigii]KAH3901321.1 hypothetical protein SCDLUD_002812 [Saccharomycodes ludwigii]
MEKTMNVLESDKCNAKKTIEKEQLNFNRIKYLNLCKTRNLNQKIVEVCLPSFFGDTEELHADNYPNFMIYYINCMHPFPLSQFQRKIEQDNQNNDTNFNSNMKKIFDNISVIDCFNLDDFSTVILKLIQSIKIKKLQDEKKQQQLHRQGEKNDHEIIKLLIVVTGLDIMWDTYNIHGGVESKSRLNTILLRIRSLRTFDADFDIKTILIFPHHFDDGKVSDVLAVKRRNRFILSNYVARYYADALV